jgi:propanol-preferring alcohol dehydrogenase
MRAMVLERPGAPLVAAERPDPAPGAGEVVLRVLACGACRTDVHLVDGELAPPATPIVPGHQVVGEVVARGAGVDLPLGARVGVPWLAWACGACDACRRGDENLCPSARFTGLHRDGGFAERAAADARFCLPIPPGRSDAESAPLLCAGLVGWRAYRLAGPAERLGLYGFGSAAHLLAQLARHEGRRVFAFTRAGDRDAQDFARALGCEWAGAATERAPAPLDAAIVFAPDGALVPLALAAVRPGGAVVCGGIHMSDIPAFPYRLLWGERTLRSVANLTRRDGLEYLAAAARAPLAVEVERFPLERADEALARIRSGAARGSVVLVPGA